MVDRHWHSEASQNTLLRTPTFILWCCALILAGARSVAPVTIVHARGTIFVQTSNAASDRDLAVRFAPVLYQALGDNPRSDYVTNFDFDGDWRGDNNWENAGEKKYALSGYVYYSVAETQTHYFLHYAFFHPRDYKGGELKGRILSELIREGIKRGSEYDPTGLADEAGVAHENDLEGVIVVVTKNGKELDRARVDYVETLGHSNFSRYRPIESPSKDAGEFKSDGQRVLLYIEPRGHGVEAYTGDEKQIGRKDFLTYKYAGKAEDPEKLEGSTVGYELVQMKSLWTKAQGKSAENKTYGTFYNFGEIPISVMQPKGRVAERKIKVGSVGLAFLGDTGSLNMARPPWGWFDKGHRDQPLGRWFFDPATVIKRDFGLDSSFSTTYVRLPFWAEK
jgi:hypothetical protein